MRKKIVGILVLTLLIAATVFPVVGTINKNEQISSKVQFLVDNDMELTDIISPVNGPATGTITPIATATNLGSEIEMADVNLTIEKILPGGGTILEYDQTVTVDFDPYQSINAVFPNWIPNDWQVVENLDVEYLVCACVTLITGTDPIPGNNCYCVVITLHYSYFHDVGVQSIDSPPECVPCNSTVSVEATIKNYGQYPERLFFVHAEISDGTSTIYDEYEGVTSWIQPDGTIIMTFSSTYFDTEGVYFVTICTELDVDENPSNDCLTKTIYVDCTPPVTTISLTPATPDGNNGWYVTCPTITLTATDAVSGLYQTFYRIDGGPWVIYNVPIVICDCLPTIEYYSVDNCGNVEVTKSMNLKIDIEPPTITFSREAIPPPPFCFRYTAVVVDECSGVDRVEFYFNDVPQATVTGPGPIFEWEHCIPGNYSVYVIAYDIAGNSEQSVTLSKNLNSLIHNRPNFMQLFKVFFQRFFNRIYY